MFLTVIVAIEVRSCGRIDSRLTTRDLHEKLN